MNTQFFTGKGDGGESTVGGKKIPKSNSIFALLGATDELVSLLGLAKEEAKGVLPRGTIDVLEVVQSIQEMLFIFQAGIASIAFENPLQAGIDLQTKHIEKLENIIRDIDVILPPIKQFVIPGGSAPSALFDVSRAVARRVEREAVLYHETHQIPQLFLSFLNRLSSVLFALARYANHILNIRESHPTYG